METDYFSFFYKSESISILNNDYDIIRWGLTNRQWAKFELNFSVTQRCWITTPVTSHSETHFPSTSDCLILSSPLLWVESPGIRKTSCNYTGRGSPSKKRLKQTASSVYSSCICYILSPVAAHVYFCARSPAFRLCVVDSSRCATVCPETWPQVHLCDFVLQCLPLLRHVLEMCATLWVKGPRDIFVWGKRKKHSGCLFSNWPGLLIIIWCRCCCLLDKIN